MTLEEIENWLAKRAPVTSGHGPEAVDLAKRVARRILPLFGEHQHHRARSLMWQHWSPRCSPPWDLDDLWGITESAYRDATADKFVAEEKARLASRSAELARRKASRLKATDVREASKRRKADALLNKKVADELGVTLRYARMLRREGTSSIERANQLAEILGTNPKDHLRRKRSSGREADFIGMVMRVHIDGGTFHDYIDDAPELHGAAGQFVAALQASYHSSVAVPDHFRHFEDLVECARSFDLDLVAATDLWRAFKLWRLDIFSAIADLQAHGRS